MPLLVAVFSRFVCGFRQKKAHTQIGCGYLWHSEQSGDTFFVHHFTSINLVLIELNSRMTRNTLTIKGSLTLLYDYSIYANCFASWRSAILMNFAWEVLISHICRISRWFFELDDLFAMHLFWLIIVLFIGN